MTDTGAYTDVVFGLFWLLGYRFSPESPTSAAPATGVSTHRPTTALSMASHAIASI